MIEPGKIIAVILVSLLLFFSSFGAASLLADEFDDAKVGFGAFEDGLYDFARLELEKFLQRYPESEKLGRVRMVLVLCSLEVGACQRAETLLTELEKNSQITEFGVDPAALELRIGRCFLTNGDAKAAWKSFHKLIKEYPQSEASLEARFELGAQFFADKNFAAANQMVTPLLRALQKERSGLVAIDRQTVYWITAFSRYQLKDYKSALPILLEINDDSKNFMLSHRERQDLYAIMFECAWHNRQIEIFKVVLQEWFKIPEEVIDPVRLSASLQLAAELLRSQGRLADIRQELIHGLSFASSKADKIIFYGLLIEIDQKNEAALKTWLEASIPLLRPASASRIKLLQSLLLLNYQAEDYGAAVAVGAKLCDEDDSFWRHERFYFPFLNALDKVEKCRQIVEYVPASLPPYDEPGASSQRRYILDIMAGNCLQKLARFDDAVTFYQTLYSHYRDPLTRAKLLATLHSLAARIGAGQKLDDWVIAEVMAGFSLDKRENEKLLRAFPELVLLVADHFFRAQLYVKAQPSLIWLEKLGLKGALAERISFMLAEACYRCEDLGEALIRYRALYEGDSKEFRYLAALRLASIYEAQGYSRKQIKLYKDLIAWESDPALKAELRHKLKALEQ